MAVFMDALLTLYKTTSPKGKGSRKKSFFNGRTVKALELNAVEWLKKAVKYF